MRSIVETVPPSPEGGGGVVDPLPPLPPEGVLVVPGSSFNVPYRHHFRVTLLPEAPTMREVFARIDRALSRRAEAATKVVPIKGKSRPAAA